MRQREYQFIFFLNISHSFYSETEIGKKHSHTWELEVSMYPKETELVRFREAEQVIVKYLERFQDKYLNQMAPFNRMNPSIENFLDHVVGDIDTRMAESGWVVKALQISENPTRTYMIDRQQMDAVRERESESMPLEKMVTQEVAEAAVTVDAEEAQVSEDSPEPQVLSKLLVDTDALRIKTQSAGNMTRIVITIP